VIGTQIYIVDSTQEVAAASIQGEPFSIWAGPVSIASGVEYREEKMDGDSDPRATRSRDIRAPNIGELFSTRQRHSRQRHLSGDAAGLADPRSHGR
jgi:hypothetical protein